MVLSNTFLMDGCTVPHTASMYTFCWGVSVGGGGGGGEEGIYIRIEITTQTIFNTNIHSSCS